MFRMKQNRSEQVEPRSYVRDHLFGFTSVGGFAASRRRHFKGLVREVPSPQASAYVEALRREGVVLIPDLLPPSVVSAMRSAVPPLDDFTQSPEGDRAYMYPDAHQIPEMGAFFDHQLIAEISRSYLSKEATPLRRTIGLKVEVGHIQSFEINYHMDTWKQRLKVFLFLEDVTADTAPMVYLRGSHRGLWRLWTEARIHRWYRTDERGFAAGGDDFYFLGSFWPHEVRQLKNDFGFTDLQCVGKAGTALVFDGRGLHHATPLKQGRRLILTNYFIHPGGHT